MGLANNHQSFGHISSEIIYGQYCKVQLIATAYDVCDPHNGSIGNEHPLSVAL